MWPRQVFWKVHSALEIVASGAEAGRQEQARNHNVCLRLTSFSSSSHVKIYAYYGIRVLLSYTRDRTFGISSIH